MYAHANKGQVNSKNLHHLGQCKVKEKQIEMESLHNSINPANNAVLLQFFLHIP